MKVLATDIGGSNARLMLAELVDTGWQPLRTATLPSSEHADLDALLEAFLPAETKLAAACLAVAGPIEGRTATLTNLGWLIDADRLAARHDIAQVALINDFAAQAHALPALPAAAIVTLQPGHPNAEGPRALLGAGTGLGVALAGPKSAWVLPSQGGHVDFAPRNDEEIALLEFLRPQLGRVSLEHVLSGPGLARLYRFVSRNSAEPARQLDAAAISAAAEAGEPTAERTLRLFARLYGSAAGNLALNMLPTGGLYLSGGIAPKMLRYLQEAAVLEAFNHKPPMTELLSHIPLYVITDESIGLIGATRLAAQLARQRD